MLNRSLYFGRDWGKKNKVEIRPPEGGAYYWEFRIYDGDVWISRIVANEMVVIYENGKIVEVHY